MKQIALWGDSILKGVLWNSEAQRYKLAEYNAIEQASRRLDLAVANHAKMGCTLPKGFEILKKNLLQNDLSGGALIEFGGNDCDFSWSEIAADPNQRHLPRTPLDVFEIKLRETIASLRQKGIVPVIANLVPNHAERYFSFITRNGLSQENILSWLGDVQHIYRFHERYNAKIEQVSREENCRLLDFRSAFLDQWHYEDFLCADGIHPNEKGYQLIGEVFYARGKQLFA